MFRLRKTNNRVKEVIKIIKIITALNNPEINNKLKEEKNIKIIGKDIQYKDAIIDLLEENKNINYLIISEKIPGEINNDNLIKKIKEINKKIKIIYFLEKPNKNKEKILLKNNINNFYYLNELNINKILEIINLKNNFKSNNKLNEFNYKNNNIENKFNNELNLNKINNEKNNYNIIYKIKKLKIFNFKKIFIFIKNKLNKKINNQENKTITISGFQNVDKKILLSVLKKIINNKKIILIDFDFKKQKIKFEFEKNKKIGGEKYVQ